MASRDNETYENRDPGLIDNSGNSITFSIRRITHSNPPYSTMHLRWVYVLKNDEIVREIDSNAHDTYEDAEAWVEQQIRKLIAGHRRRASSSRPPRSRLRRASSGWRTVLLIVAIILASPVVAALYLAATMPH